MNEEKLSSHPVDRLIRAIARHELVATEDDIERIIARIATAQFFDKRVVIPELLREYVDVHELTGQRISSLTMHHLKRIHEERQWAVGTSEEQYLTDLRDAARSTSSRLAVYIRHGGAMAICVSSTSAVVPAERLGALVEPLFLVFYSADRGMIVSGYQASSLSRVAIPGEAIWLR